MKNKPLAILSPICLCLYAANANALLEPFTLGASEQVQHQTNVDHTPTATPDWISTTEFTAALDEAVGRDKLVANAAVNYNGYKNNHGANNVGYRAGAEFDWNTIGDLSGALGADTSRKRYVYGLTADPSTAEANGTGPVTERNMQTDSHVFARLQLGGPSRWQIFGGADANQRRFSASNFSGEDEHQWSANLGTRYATSADLAFGVVGHYTRGEYPHVVVATFGGNQITAASKFNTRSVDLTTHLVASGNSTFDASLGYTSESADALDKDARFVDGSLNWKWTPPSRFTVNLGLKRSSDVDMTSTGINTGTLDVSNLKGVSINNLALLDVTYELTGKINLEATSSYSQRKYAQVLQPDGSQRPGTLRTTSFSLAAHYQPTRNSDISCGASHERRGADSAIVLFLPGYTDNTVQCTASIKFD